MFVNFSNVSTINFVVEKHLFKSSLSLFRFSPLGPPPAHQHRRHHLPLRRLRALRRSPGRRGNHEHAGGPRGLRPGPADEAPLRARPRLHHVLQHRQEGDRRDAVSPARGLEDGHPAGGGDGRAHPGGAHGEVSGGAAEHVHLHQAAGGACRQ